MPDQFPGSFTAQMDDLARRVEVLEAQGSVRPPLIEASQGWILRARSTPPAPGGDDIHIYAQSDEFWVRSAFGTIALRQQAQAEFVSAISLPSAGATYTSSEQALLNAAISKINVILLELKLATLMASS